MRKLAALIVLVVFISGKNSDEQMAQELDNLFSAEFKSDEPGGAVLVMKEGKVIFEKGYGLSDIQTKEKITPETVFNVGSITKTFVSNTILSLVEEGKLSVDDNLTKFFPNFKNKKISDQVKIHHLLSHTSGLPDNRRKFIDKEKSYTAKDREHWSPIEQNDSLDFEPGSRFVYSNPSFNGLALIIEKVTGKRWQDVVEERIFKPSGMPTSKITDGPFPESGVAHGYYKDKDGIFRELDYGETPAFAAAGNGGVWSSVRELANYEQAIQKAVFLKNKTIGRSRTISEYSNWKDNSPAFIGYSWFVGKTADGSKVITHTGTQGGFFADYESIPEKGLFYIILCNRPIDRKKFRNQAFEILGVKLNDLPVLK